jgi:hypothetical protein
MRWSRWARRSLVAGGALVMVYAVAGALGDPDARPAGTLLFLAGVLIAHDALLLPATIGVGVLIGRYVPAGVRAPVRAAAFVTVTLLVVATPLVLGLGRRLDDSSALPLPYGRGLATLLALVWSVAIGVAVRRLARGRRGSSGREVDHEPAAAAGVGDVDAAAVGLHQAAHDRQAQPAAGVPGAPPVARRARRFAAERHLEDLG